MAKKAQFYFPLVKVTPAPDGTVYVESVATAEVLDNQGEVILHEAAKAAFTEWTDYFTRVTGGRSMGNIREMHQPWAAGKAVSWWSDDEARTTHLAVRVVDQEAAAKVREGVYTGLSIGADKVERTIISLDGKNVPAVTSMQLREVSLVDKPACPVATFQVVKRAAEGRDMPESVEKGAAEAAAAASDAMKALLTTLAAACGIEGDPDTLTMQDILDAVKSLRYGKAGLEAGAAMGKADAPAEGAPSGDPPSTAAGDAAGQEDPEAGPAPGAGGDPTPEPAAPPETAGATAGKADGAAATLAAMHQDIRKLGDAVQALNDALAKVGTGGLVKAAPTDQGELMKRLDDLTAMLQNLPAPPPGRPVAKDMGGPASGQNVDPAALRKAVESLEAAGVIPAEMRQAVRLNLAAQHVGA